MAHPRRGNLCIDGAVAKITGKEARACEGSLRRIRLMLPLPRDFQPECGILMFIRSFGPLCEPCRGFFWRPPYEGLSSNGSNTGPYVLV